MTSSEGNTHRVAEIRAENPCLSIQGTGDNLSLPKTTVQNILSKHLRCTTVFSMSVPHNLSNENKRQRLGSHFETLELFNSNPLSFLTSHYFV